MGRRPDRKLATVLFTDIVGSTELATELADRRWQELLARHHRIVSASGTSASASARIPSASSSP
jgi:class 3 adenylate cyclase